MIEYKSVSLSNQVFEKIEYDILSGKYKIGEIISEKRLSSELGVSRTPIREALGRLSEEGLVGDSPSGTVVLGITDEDVDDFYEVKRRIEILAVCRACKLIDEDGLRDLENIVEHQEFYAMKGDTEKIRDLDTDFHATLYKYCGSRVLEKILLPLHRKIIKYRSASLKGSKNRQLESIKEHREIYGALKEKDENKLERLMKNHIENAYISICAFREGQENK
ncbi:FCD domain protein [Eubacterium nodatum ATCC 33099]|nr:FCD domain protein [Eubacterium nodatum ATCC 33099]